MATKRWYNPEQKKRYDDFRELIDFCYRSVPVTTTGIRGGLLGTDWVLTESKREEIAATFKQFPVYRWLEKQDNYREAVRGLAVRAKQTKRAAYSDELAEIRLVRSFLSPLHINEISELFPVENTYPTAEELRALLKDSESLLTKLRTYSGLSAQLLSYSAQTELTRLVDRINSMKRGYRKPRADGNLRGRVFAQSVAVNLNLQFGEAAPVVLAPLCGLVDYSPDKGDLSALARDAIAENAKLMALHWPS